MKKILLIIIDGLGDEKIPKFGGKTPLEIAKTPNLDFLAKNGICGLVFPYLLSKEKFPSSEITHLALFGFNPKKYFQGRGVYEALGAEIKLNKKDIALRVNFATVNEKLEILDRRAGRIEETEKLISALKKIKIPKIKIFLKRTFGHRAVLILKGKNLSPKISSNDPKIVGIKVRKILPLKKTKSAKFTAQILNRFLEKAHFILKNHPLNLKRIKKGKLPANYLLVRGAGSFKKIISFEKKYKLKACCIAGGTLYKGIGRFLGMDLIKVKGATGLSTTNLKGKILTAKKAFKNYDFVFCHIKAADNLAEDGNFIGKRDFIERIDKNLKPILNLKDVLIVITSDHSTCSLLRRHCKKEIPILIYKKGMKADRVSKFSEKSCKKGKFSKIKQIELMEKILKYAKI